MAFSPTETTLPDSWRESMVSKYLDQPYSPEALAEPRKDWIEVAPVDIGGFPLPESGILATLIKNNGEEFDLTEQPAEYHEVHTLFMSATRLILDRRFINSRVFFDHWTAHLDPGEVHSFSVPHMDGTMPGGFNMAHKVLNGYDDELELKLVGTVTNERPTAILQGPTTAEDFEGETLTHLKPGVEHDRSFIVEELPVSMLNLAPPSILHYAQPAICEIGMRHFMRWQVYV